MKEYYNSKFDGLGPSEVLRKVYDDCKEWLIESREKLYHLARTNTNLGIYHFHNGDLNDAILRFHILKFFNSLSPESLYYMGRCYMEKFNANKAKKYFLKYNDSNDPSFRQEVSYCLKVIDKSTDIKEIPLSIVAHNFDKIAGYLINKSLSNKAKNSLLQQRIHDMLHEYLDDNNRSVATNVLDIGCGVGKLGQYLRISRTANAIVGIDISKRALEFASTLEFDKAPVYSKLINQDIRTFYSRSKDYNIYDVIIASNFITYFRDVQFFLEHACEFSTPDSALILSFKNSNKKEYDFIYSIEEWRYSKEYIKSVISETAWQVVEEQEVKEPEDFIILLLAKKSSN